MNKQQTTFAIIFIAFLMTVLFYQQSTHKKETHALRIKLALLAKDKKKATPWFKIKKEIISELNLAVNKDESKKLEEKILLVNEVEKNSKMSKNLELEQVNKALEEAEELISQIPDSYSAHKAKLILLLTKEGKYKQSIDERDLEQLLDVMASFDLMSEKTLRKESFLIAKVNGELLKLEEKIDLLEDELDTEGRTQEEIDLVENEIEDLILIYDETESELEEGLLSDDEYQLDDLVEIPMYRSFAKNDFESVFEQAEDLIQNFPDSIRGHFFYIKALEKTEQDDVEDYISNLELPESKLKNLKERLANTRNKSINEYWKLLRF